MAGTKQKAAKPAPAPEVTVEVGHEERLVKWIRANQKPLGIGLAALVVVVLATWFMATAAKRKENFARTQLEQAWNAEDAGNAPLAAGEFQRVIQTYGGTQAALEARIALNQNRLMNGQSQLAADDLDQFLGTSPPAAVAVQGYLLRGAALENLGKAAEAGASYEKAADLATLDFQKAEALLAAARAFRDAGDIGKASTALKTIIEKYPESAAYPAAEIRLGEILKGS
jgi:tetratricopeptide (TPR) repeat protein